MPDGFAWKALATVVVVTVILPATALAQAAIPPPGVASFDLSYQYSYGGDHLFSTDRIDGESTRGYVAEGKRWFLGDTRAHYVSGSLDLGIHRKLALTLAAAFVRSAYFGLAPADIQYDDGQYHTYVQDGLARIRSPFILRTFIVTPSLGVTFPIEDYQISGHSAPGRGTTEVILGLHTLHGLGAYSSFGHIALDVGYGGITSVSDFDLTRLTASFRMAYYQSRRLTFFASGRQLLTFGGLEWVSDDPTEPAAHGESGVDTHSQASAARSTFVGFGVEWGLGRNLALHAAAHKTVWGENVDDIFVAEGGVSTAFRLFGSNGEAQSDLPSSSDD